MIVNRHATSMTGVVTDLVVRSLAGLVDLKVERTQYRGHARDLAAEADTDLVIVLGGDGSVNEVVNGLMGQEAPRPRAAQPGAAGRFLARKARFPVRTRWGRPGRGRPGRYCGPQRGWPRASVALPCPPAVPDPGSASPSSLDEGLRGGALASYRGSLTHRGKVARGGS